MTYIIRYYSEDNGNTSYIIQSNSLEDAKMKIENFLKRENLSHEQISIEIAN